MIIHSRSIADAAPRCGAVSTNVTDSWPRVTCELCLAKDKADLAAEIAAEPAYEPCPNGLDGLCVSHCPLCGGAGVIPQEGVS